VLSFISVGLTNGVKIKWLADYCGTSVAMIEKHYGKYFGGDSEEQLSRLFGAKSETLECNLRVRGGAKTGTSSGNI
jgi:hypothetical protein